MKTIGYLSGAPRVSTLPEAEATGPKSHILGFIKAFEKLDWEVKPFIVGNRMPKKLYSSGSRRLLSRSIITRIFADLIRIYLGYKNEKIAYKEIGNVRFVYERFGTFQHLGRTFKKHNIPWIIETNGPFYAEASEQRKSLAFKKIAKLLEYDAYKNCDLLVCVTNELKNIIIKEFKLSPQKIFVIPNGVDTNLFDPNGVKKEKYFAFPTIGYVGALIPRQGLEMLIFVVSELINEGIEIGLVIIGEGPEKINLSQQIYQLKLNDHVKLLGLIPRDKIPEYINGFDLGFSGQLVIGNGHLSRMYHSPLKLYEYLSMGKPVIASEYEDALRLLKDSKVGYLFTPGSKEALKNTIKFAISDQKEWKKKGEDARHMVINDHSWEGRIKLLIQKIDEIEN